jgi:uncharacterized RDD family membrane protein YckC
VTTAAPETPSYAGLATRTLAFAVDAVIINVLAWLVGAIVALGLALLSAPDRVMTVVAAISAVVALLWTVSYFVFFWSGNGRTPGNRLLGITVRDAEGSGPLRVRRAILRFFALVLAALPLGAGILLILVDGRRRGLQDRIARTVVVYTDAEARSRRAASRNAAYELRSTYGGAANGGEPAAPSDTHVPA